MTKTTETQNATVKIVKLTETGIGPLREELTVVREAVTLNPDRTEFSYFLLFGSKELGDQVIELGDPTGFHALRALLQAMFEESES